MLRSSETLHIYEGLIGYGIAETEDALVQALWQLGNSGMAADYVNSGNPRLEEAGRAWAKENGYVIMPMPGGGGGPAWGSH